MSDLKCFLNEDFLVSLCEKLKNEQVVYGTFKVEDLGGLNHCIIEFWTPIEDDAE